jgi:NDP-sugar pyrophosphorylase family protein
LNGDTYLDVDLGEMLSCHQDAGAVATLALMRVDLAERYGAVRLDEGGRILHFGEKQQSGAGLANAGIYVCEPSLLGYFPERDPLSLELDVFPALASQGRLRGHVVEGYVRDIGTPESYAQFVQDVEQNRLAKE